MALRNLPGLAEAVQRNCDISDARFAGDYGMCTFLLKMREYYRWENELPFGRNLPKDELGEWLKSREQAWERIEEEAFEPLPLASGALDPFEAAAANRELLPQGGVYGAGYGRMGKPVFFLGALQRIVEGRFGILGRGEETHGHERASFADSSTIEGERSFRHFRCPSGHSRLKQGLHSRSRLSRRARCDSGGV